MGGHETLQPSQIDQLETEYDVAQPIWTKDELLVAFENLKNSKIDPFKVPLGERIHIAQKNFSIEGDRFSVALAFESPDDENNINWDNVYLPFPDESILQLQYNEGQPPTVQSIPLLFAIRQLPPFDEDKFVNFALTMDDLPDLQGNYIYDTTVKVEETNKNLLLPNNPQRLSTAKITFHKRENPPDF